MNFIAHIHLSNHKPGLVVGNYIADLIRQRDVQGLPENVMKGVRLHRFIDAFTDAHEINKRILFLLYPRHRKYASVLLDIYYDFFLIRHWDRFDEIPFLKTCRETYLILDEHMDDIPRSIHRNIENLLQKQWLEDAYGSVQGLHKTFFFLKKRTSKPELIDDGVDTLFLFEKEMEEAFLKFYPQLVTAAKAFLKDGVIN